MDARTLPTWEQLPEKHSECTDGYCGCRERLIETARKDVQWLEQYGGMVPLYHASPTLIRNLDEEIGEAIDRVRDDDEGACAATCGLTLKFKMSPEGDFVAEFNLASKQDRKGEWTPGRIGQGTLPLANTDACPAPEPDDEPEAPATIVAEDPRFRNGALPQGPLPALPAGEEVIDAEYEVTEPPTEPPPAEEPAAAPAPARGRRAKAAA